MPQPELGQSLHYIYSYLTQGQQEVGLIAVSPCVQRIISKGIVVYATPIIQPIAPVAHLTTGLVIYGYLLGYLPMNPCRLPQQSSAILILFTDASGGSPLTPSQHL